MSNPKTKEEAALCRYGHGPHANAFNPALCAYGCSSGRLYHYQCPRKPVTGPGFLYCTQHAKMIR